jgi:hypothetical protein
MAQRTDFGAFTLHEAEQQSIINLSAGFPNVRSNLILYTG